MATTKPYYKTKPNIIQTYVPNIKQTKVFKQFVGYPKLEDNIDRSVSVFTKFLQDNWLYYTILIE